ncbi:hypothetical protein C1645_820907 [Glomus cerebriforme]|uniref:DUF7729 domain-containing protein n=1 Tax=Glomus cerebriforme TaxID=658196 RepID=A0A397T5X2_9GLOM|nr:hypothetical protein C1645_820907 [Glomus cerebriforme]
MKKSFFTSLFLVASASLGFANNLPVPVTPKLPPSLPTADPITLISELSPQCQAALFSIVANPEFFQCVPVAALLPLLTDPTLLPSVIKDPLHNAPKLLPIVDAVCADPKCSEKGVAAASQAVAEGCAKDANNPLVPLIQGVLLFYSPVRDVICFKDNKDQYCTVETVTTVLTLPPPPKDFKLLGGLIDKLAVAEPKFICTPCNKAMVNTLIDFFEEHPEALAIVEEVFHIGQEELFVAKLYGFLKCGFQFLDGKVPDSTIDPSKFTYQNTDDKSVASQQEINLFMLGSLLASTLVLN